MSSLTDHNNKVVAKYWKDFRSNGTNLFLARCYSKVRQGTGKSFHYTIGSFENMMYFEDPKERNKQLHVMTAILFKNEIEFIFEKRRAFRVDATLPLSHLDLFAWMKQTNPEMYEKFKIYLSKKLLSKATEGNCSEKEIKEYIQICIWSWLKDVFIKLY